MRQFSSAAREAVQSGHVGGALRGDGGTGPPQRAVHVGDMNDDEAETLLAALDADERGAQGRNGESR